ncbi:MAG TPA: hypothetical protein PLV25_06340 [Opitutales bacterium]|nr:hypothetical protein [Opitutales bacterium]
MPSILRRLFFVAIVWGAGSLFGANNETAVEDAIAELIEPPAEELIRAPELGPRSSPEAAARYRASARVIERTSAYPRARKVLLLEALRQMPGVDDCMQAAQ